MSSRIKIIISPAMRKVCVFIVLIEFANPHQRVVGPWKFKITGVRYEKYYDIHGGPSVIVAVVRIVISEKNQ